MSLIKNYFVITDVGSTTTKAILVDNNTTSPKVLGISHANTTVEAPTNDVCYGVFKAIQDLQTISSVALLSPQATAKSITFKEYIGYLTTSSAGGGLQILVIGLTMFDSAASARRAAFGAGGVILDVFAIDDKRKSTEQMLAMRNLHPDMILLCGGTDGGALSSVLRLAEILRIAKPLPKYATNEQIPTIFAGNIDAQSMIRKIISQDFNLVMLPNLRPSPTEENLKPTQEMIQKLFMEHVMERAPGYAELKKHVDAPILPTPMGVLGSLITTTEDVKRNFFAIDIGGATTDVFSYIMDHFQRTVSANLGMSYSALNVLSEAGIETLMAYLPAEITEQEVRNYIGNKTLYPTYNPSQTSEYRIEHAIARQAIRLALVQHQQMHFNTEKIGFLDKLKSDNVEGFEAKFNYQVNEEKYYFRTSDIDVLIGAGGIFAHATNPNQCTAILIDSFDAYGITEIWLDKDFITPHLGVLSTANSKAAKHLLNNDCMVKLALHIRPHQSTNNKKPVLQVTITENGKNREMSIMPDSIVYLPADKQRILNIQPLGKSILQYDSKAKQIQTELPVLIDTRKNTDTYCPPLEHELGLYNPLPEIVPNVAAFCNETTPETGSFTKTIHLPYKGDVMVETGDSVIPDDIVASNKFAPPRLFIVNPYLGVDDLTEDLIRSSLLVSAGDLVDFDTPLRQFDTLPSKKYIGKKFPSPIRGKLEFIDYSSGILVLSEIQDYSSKPVTINLAEQMGCKPRLALRYFKKNLGDFVHQGDVLAKRIETNDGGEEPCFVKAPSTGEIYEINTKTAEITIQYKMNPHNHFAHVHGTVSEVQGNDLIVIDYQGTKLEGKLGVGICTHGEFIYLKTEDEIDTAYLHEKIVAINACADTALINKLIKYQVKGLICPGLNQTDLVTLLQKELGVVNTGNESLPLCVVITDSFGAKQFSKSFCETLKLATGKHCYLEPHTRIRAGVARPFICFM